MSSTSTTTKVLATSQVELGHSNQEVLLSPPELHRFELRPKSAWSQLHATEQCATTSSSSQMNTPNIINTIDAAEVELGPVGDGLRELNPESRVPHTEWQSRPPQFKNFATEALLILVCTAGPMISSITKGQVVVTQTHLQSALQIAPSQTPWISGSSLLATGLSVIVSGSFADLAPPKPFMVAAFLWQGLWNAVMAAAVRPNLRILFFVARAMSGLSIGILVSSAMSILGRVYKPGMRKTMAFSIMATGSPLGFWLGCVQGGALAEHLPWIFGTTCIFVVLCGVVTQCTAPPLAPAEDRNGSDAPTLRQFDYFGAPFVSLGSGLVLFGLTQGPVVNWNPYTYSLIIVGVLCFTAFYFIEARVPRPLIPNALWKTPGFLALLMAYFLGYGGFNGAWQFYIIQFWQRYQGVSPLTCALYIIPNAIVGVLATWLVSKTLHVFPGHWIFVTSMTCFALAPGLSLPQTPKTSYWALSMPAIIMATFGADMSFAAAAIFVTSSVPRSYQGSAGSLLVTVQNLSSAIMTSIADSIGVETDETADGQIGLQGLRMIWWFSLATALAGGLITITLVRIPKAEEKEHVQ